MKIRRLLVVVFFLLAVFLASIRAGRPVYALLYIAVLLPPVSILYTYLVNEKIRINQTIESRNIIKNSPVPYVCRVANETRFIPFTQVEFTFHTGFFEMKGEREKYVFTLPTGASEEIRTDIVCNRRGRYTVGVDKIMVRDVLGLIRPVFNAPVEYTVTVYPRVVRLDTLGIFTFEGVRASLSQGTYETTPGDTVHEYVTGDDVRLIHWKASARTGTLQVRQLSGVERPNMVIVVDTHKYAGGETAVVREDNLLEALLSICDYCVSRGIGVDVFAGEERFVLLDNDDFNEFYNWTCDMQFSRLAPAVHLPDVSFTCCALLTCGKANETAQELIDAADAGAECAILQFGSVPEQYQTARLHCIGVPDNCEISEILSR